jgi:HSP20 family protein
MFSMLKSQPATPAATQAPAAPAHPTAAPRCDIRETDAAVLIHADMPGVPAGNVDVRLDGDVLTLTGRSAAAEPASFVPLWREYTPRTYERSFRLGHAIDPDKVQAAIKDGVLTVTLHKRASAQPRRIQVQAA